MSDDESRQDAVSASSIDGLGSVDERVRVQSVKALGATGSVEGIPALEHTAETDENAHVRFLARAQVESIRRRAAEGPPRIDVVSAERTRGEGALDAGRFAASLADPDRGVRLNAVKVAMAARDGTCVAALTARAAVETDHSVLGAIVQAVAYLGGRSTVPFVVGILTQPPSPKVQEAAVTALGLIHDVAVYPYVVKALTLNDPGVARVAYRELKKLGKSNLVNLLRNMLAAKPPWMKRSAIKACQLLGRSRQIRALLEERVEDADPQTRALVRKALEGLSVKAGAIMPGPGDSLVTSLASMDAAPLMAAATGKVSPEERQKAIQAIVDTKDASRVPLLLDWLRDGGDPRVRASVVIALGRVAGADAIGAVAGCLEETDGRVRANAVEALGLLLERTREDRIRGLLKPALADRNNRVKANAVVALRGRDEAAEALEQMVYSGSPTYQRSAVYAITVLRRPEYKPLLDFLARAKDRLVSRQASEALEYFLDGDAVPALPSAGDLTIREDEQAVRDPAAAGQMDAGLVNPWDSTLLSEEDAAALLRRKARRDDATAEGSTAADLAESFGSTLVLAASVFYFVAALAIVATLGWYAVDIIGGDPSAQGFVLAAVLVVLLVGAVEGLIPRPPDGPGVGTRVGRREAPRLWALVDKAAESLRVRKPESILIHPYSEVGMYDVSGTPFLPMSGSPQLRLGLASLRALGVDQLRALISAELARHAVAAKNMQARVYLGMDAVLHQVVEKLFHQGDARVFVNPLFHLTMVFRAVFRLATHRAFVRITLQADRMATAFCGADILATALTKYAISARLFDQDLAEIVQGASKHGAATGENLYAYYRGFLDGLNEKRLLRLRTEIFKYSPPGDRVFPPLQRRLDALPPGDASEARPDMIQAATLLENQEKIERDFSARFIEIQQSLASSPVIIAQKDPSAK